MDLIWILAFGVLACGRWLITYVTDEAGKDITVDLTDVALVLMLGVAAILHQRTLLEAYGMMAVSSRDIFIITLAVGLGLTILIAQEVSLRQTWRHPAAALFFSSQLHGPYRALYRLKTGSTLLVGPLAVMNSTLLEELVFRGFLLLDLVRFVPQWALLFCLIQAVLFGLLHWLPLRNHHPVLPRGILLFSWVVPTTSAMAFGLLTLGAGSLVPAWIAHTLVNYLTHVGQLRPRLLHRRNASLGDG